MIEDEGMTKMRDITLHDLFALAALAGGLEQELESNMAYSRCEADWWHTPEKIARRAWAIADAMIAERSR